MDDMAETWGLSVAVGYPPPRYREHLAGGRLVDVLKEPKPGVRLIGNSDAILKLVAKGLLEFFEASFT